MNVIKKERFRNRGSLGDCVNFATRIPVSVNDKLEKVAADNHLTKSEVTRRCFEFYFKELEAGNTSIDRY